MGNTSAKPVDGDGASGAVSKEEQQRALDAFLSCSTKDSFDTYLRSYLLGCRHGEGEKEKPPSTSTQLDRLSRLLLSSDQRAQSDAVYELADLEPPSQQTLADFVQSVCKRGIAQFWHLHPTKKDELDYEWLASWLLVQSDSASANTLGQIYNDGGNIGALDFSMLDNTATNAAGSSSERWVAESSTAGKVDRRAWRIWWQGSSAFRELVDLALAGTLFPSSASRPSRSNVVYGVRDENLAAPQIPDSLHDTWTHGSDGQGEPLLLPCAAWALSRELPRESRKQWERVYSSKHDGNSWSSFQGAVERRGSILLLVKEKKTNSSAGQGTRLFGAYMDSDLERRPSWYGSSLNLLFTNRSGGMHVYRATGFNSHYQYFNYATKTLPNGLGVGGQLEHFGLWIDSAFTCGHSSSTATFDSEQLSHGREFSIEAVEAWLVRPSVRDDGDVGGPKMSALDTNPDAVAMLEMANKTMYSKMVREPQLDYDSD